MDVYFGTRARAHTHTHTHTRERERERETDRQTDRQTDGGRGREWKGRGGEGGGRKTENKVHQTDMPREKKMYSSGGKNSP